MRTFFLRCLFILTLLLTAYLVARLVVVAYEFVNVPYMTFDSKLFFRLHITNHSVQLGIMKTVGLLTVFVTLAVPSALFAWCWELIMKLPQLRRIVDRPAKVPYRGFILVWVLVLSLLITYFYQFAAAYVILALGWMFLYSRNNLLIDAKT